MGPKLAKDIVLICFQLKKILFSSEHPTYNPKCAFVIIKLSCGYYFASSRLPHNTMLFTSWSVFLTVIQWFSPIFILKKRIFQRSGYCVLLVFTVL